MAFCRSRAAAVAARVTLTQRHGLRHVIGESFVRRLGEDPTEVLADDPFELVEGVVDGSAAFRPGIAEGAEPVGSGLLAEPSADEADDHAADQAPTATAPRIHPAGFQLLMTATARSAPPLPMLSRPLPVSSARPMVRAVWPAVVLAPSKVLMAAVRSARTSSATSSSRCDRYCCSSPPTVRATASASVRAGSENLSVEHLRNEVFLGFERRFDKAVGASERLHLRVPQAGGEPVTGMAEQLAGARSAEPAAELLEPLDALRQILVGGPADEPEDVGDAPFQLLGEHGRFVVFSADRRFSVGEQAAGLLVEHAEPQRCGVPRQGLGEQKLQRRQVGPCEQPLRPVLVPLLPATVGVGTGVGIAGAGEGGPFGVDGDDGDVGQVDQAEFVADVAHVLMDRPGQVPPGRLASHPDGMAPAGVAAVEDGHHRLAVAADPLERSSRTLRPVDSGCRSRG